MMSKVLLTLLVLAIGLLFGLGLLNWLIGCGETVYYEDGTWETLDCLYIPYETTRGTW